jgi:glycosyltransferase involved in cell wall biosynthesis
VGNIEPKKGVDQLVNAYAACAAETGCDLVIAGRFCWKSGTVRRALRRPARHGRVHLPGRVPDAALAALYQHALAFVFPSRVEGFGLPVLEAMAAGTPVIHSDHPVLLETAGGAGYAFPVDDVEELSRALITLAREPGLRRELTHRGRERAASCRWEAWGRTVRRIYRELVGGGDRSAGGEHRSGDQGAGTGRIR